MESNDNSKLNSAGPLTDPDKYTYFDHCVKRRAEDVDFLVEDWYPKLKNFTSKTIFLELTEKEGQSIVNFYRTRYNKRSDLTLEDTQLLKALEVRIDNAIKKEFSGKAAFVRLSTRSPKDGISNYANEIMKKYESDYIKLKKEWKPENWNLNLTEEESDVNVRMAAMFRAQETQLKCKSGSDAMSLLLSSERVYRDINTELTVAEAGKARNNPNEKWNMKVSLREWMDNIDGFLEFRCFVKGNVFRAISQYNHYLIIGDLLNSKTVETIKEKILSYWDKNVKQLLFELKDYVIDFAVVEDRVYIIELNPYMPTTGPALFDWNNDKELQSDLTNVEGNEFNVPFRIKTTIYPNIVCMFNDFYLEEMEKNSQEEPYWVLMSKINPKYREEKESKCQIF